MKGSEFISRSIIRNRDGILARPGERCDYVPVEALARLLEKGRIAPAPVSDEPVKPKVKKGGK